MVTEYIYLCIHQQMYFLCEKRLLYFYSFLLWLKLKATERGEKQQKITNHPAKIYCLKWHLLLKHLLIYIYIYGFLRGFLSMIIPF